MEIPLPRPLPATAQVVPPPKKASKTASDFPPTPAGPPGPEPVFRVLGHVAGYSVRRVESLPTSLSKLEGCGFESMSARRGFFGAGCRVSGGCVDGADLCE